MPTDVRWNAGIAVAALVISIGSWAAGYGSLGISSLAVAVGMGLGTAFDLRKAVRTRRPALQGGEEVPDT